MSVGRHHAWRRMALGMALQGLLVKGPVLDLAAGTLDFPMIGPKSLDWVAADFSLPMLEMGIRKLRRSGLSDTVSLALSDAHALPFRDQSFAMITVGFGIRNFAEQPLALSEIRRVLKPRGRLVVLDIVSPRDPGLSGQLFAAAFRALAPVLGLVFAGDRDAYTYLPESVASLSADSLSNLMQKVDLRLLHTRLFAFGSVAILVGEKPNADAIEGIE